MANTKKITKEMTIGNILRSFPDTVPTFLAAGLHCLGCPGAQSETLEQAAIIHGIELDKLLNALNAVVAAVE